MTDVAPFISSLVHETFIFPFLMQKETERSAIIFAASSIEHHPSFERRNTIKVELRGGFIALTHEIFASRASVD